MTEPLTAPLQRLLGLDLDLLTGIAKRLVSVESVEDATSFATKIREATEIAIAAGLRIAGVEDSSARAMISPERNQMIDAVCAKYLYQEAATAESPDEEV